MDIFDKKQTDWAGLWYHPENGGFSSETISLAKLKKFKGAVRLYVRKNKFYKKDSNRPNYTFCLKDADSETFKLLDVIEDEEGRTAKENENGDWWTSDGERLYTKSEVQYAIDRAVEDGVRGYRAGDCVVGDYLEVW